MRKIRIADLKAHLSRHLRAVQRGQRLTVLSRNIPVAEIVPIERPSAGGLVITPARGSPKDIPVGPRLKLPFDPVALLLEDRAKR